jgi:hypothetical protein
VAISLASDASAKSSAESGGLGGISGDKCAINISKLLISLAPPKGSSPSLTTN